MNFCKASKAQLQADAEGLNTNQLKIFADKITFREELMLRADEYEKNINIQKDIENIKKNLNEYYYSREYTISLIKVIKGSVAIGQCTPGHISLFVPCGVAPLHYKQLFINEFNKLGFTEDCMELWEQEYKNFYEYNIVLKW
jgi:hypothetical protein